MTDIEQALAVEIDRHWLERTPEGGAICTCGGWSFTLDDRPIDVGERLLPFSEHIASATIASEPIRAIVRQAAIVAAVERLGDDWWMEHGNGCYSVTVMRAGVPMGFPADTLPAAIAAALGEDDE